MIDTHRTHVRGTQPAWAGCLLVVVGMALATPGRADDPAPSSGANAVASAAASDNGENSLDTIVVTARRRDESLERVPVAISALSEQQLQEQQIHTESDLQAATPGLTIRETSSQNQFNYSIRGQSVDAFSGSSPGVLPYVDDLQVSSSTAGAFFDLQSVQVVKGPQGTLFGRNATGGAVLYETQKPTDQLGGYISGELGNFDTREVEGAFNVPLLSDKVLLRISGLTDSSRGYVHNLYDGAWLGGDDKSVGRVSLTVKPIDGLVSTTTYQYGHVGGSNVPTELYSANACGSTNNGSALFAASACLYNPAFPGWDAFLAAHPKAFPGGVSAFVGYQQSIGPWNTSLDSPLGHDSHAEYLVNTTAYDVTPQMTIKNIVGFTASHSAEQTDFDGTNYPIFGEGTPADPSAEFFRTNQFSDELHLQGKALDSRLDYIVGAYGSFERDEDNFPLFAFDVEPAVPATQFHYHWRIDDQSRAVFTQETYDMGSGFSVTGGFRQTWETTGIRQLDGSVFAGAPSEQQSAAKPSWTIDLDYQVTKQLMFYAATRGSWRTGGYNGTAPAFDAYASGGGNKFRPETTRDVEVGMKYSGVVAEVPVRLNVAVYDQWVDDIQRTAYLILNGSPLAITVNVPTAEITGAEADGEIRPANWLLLGASVSYSDARYTNNSVSYFSDTLRFGPYADTPRWTGNVFGEAREPLPGTLGELALRADYYLQSTQLFSNLEATINPGTELPSYHLLNMSLTWDKIGATGLQASLYGRNLTNEQYYVGGIPQGADLGLNQAIPGKPRMYGIELRYSF
jgi:iron complex outermembrane receptor protein